MILEKIKKHGIIGSLKVVWTKVVSRINVFYYYFFWIFPINNQLIVFESQGDLSDNSYAIYDYMNEIGLLKKYKVIWLVDNVLEAEKRVYDNTYCVFKYPNTISIKRSYYLATCKWFIYDHCNIFAHLRKRKRQNMIYLSHGWGYKASKGWDTSKDLTHPDFIVSTGELAARGLSFYWNEPIDKIIITGYPRIDYLFKYNKKVESYVQDKLQFAKYEKVFFWMPTFRQSNTKSLSEDYFTNQTGLPLFETFRDLENFSNFLKEQQILIVFKLHHLQADLPIFQERFDNILILRDSDLYREQIQLYQVVKYADVIISDYSSISIDALVMNIPLIFILDDYDDYDISRGLYPKNAIDYMPGYHIYTVKELENCIIEIKKGVDRYSNERKVICNQYHTYSDSNSAMRVLKSLNLK